MSCPGLKASVLGKAHAIYKQGPQAAVRAIFLILIPYPVAIFSYPLKES